LRRARGESSPPPFTGTWKVGRRILMSSHLHGGAATEPDRVSRGDVTTTAQSLCLDALTLAIETTAEETGRWYVSAMNLQSACVDLCVACRTCWNFSAWHVVVTSDTPRRVWLRGGREAPGNNQLCARVPLLPVRALTMVWCPKIVLARLSEGGIRYGARAGVFGAGCGWRLCRRGRGLLSWPETLRKLTFGREFNEPIQGILWPPSLEEIHFGASFNQPIQDIVWPASLRRLTFGHYFDQPVDIDWPETLRQLTFGHCFDQSIDAVKWPSSLQELVFGAFFNKPIDGVL
ncbi:unnamed protein product, partial [Ectocarpus fasciculatus]